VLGEICLIVPVDGGVACRSDQGNQQCGAKARRFATETNINRKRDETKNF
jgi:hypothetical protein